MLNKLIGKKNTVSDQSIAEQIVMVKNKKIPAHVAIIMDGNGRWAKKRNLPRIAGHHEGMKTVRKIAKMANEIGVKVLTLYAFSTENWKRPKLEVDFLMRLPGEFLNTYLGELIEKNVRVEMIGDLSLLPKHTQLAIQKAIDKTKNNDGMVLNFAMNYGSRAEMIRCTQELAKMAANGQLNWEDIDEDMIDTYLMTSHLPEPDLLIRTSGEIRLSNFMLWQLAYAELSFTDVLWPDFDEGCLLSEIEEFQSRSRRFGSVEGEEQV